MHKAVRTYFSRYLPDLLGQLAIKHSLSMIFFRGIVLVGFFLMLQQVVPQVMAGTGAYSVVTPTLDWETFAGTTESLGDDEVSSAITIPFEFTFFGNTYSQLIISSNGFITFDLNSSSRCCSGGVLPGSSRNNLIAGWWTDLYPPGAGTVQYTTLGSAPNRRFIIQFDGIPECCGSTPDVNFEIKLFETSNNIEIHYNGTSNTSGTVTAGIQDDTSTLGYADINSLDNPTKTNTATKYTYIPPAAPSVGSPSQVGIDFASASISATINANADSTEGYFLWGTQNVSCQNLPNKSTSSTFSGGNLSLLATTFSALSPGITYYYCAAAVNSLGVAYSSVSSFTQTLGGSACSSISPNSDYTFSTSCSPRSKIDGVDKGNANANTGLMQIASGQTLTVSFGQIVTYGILYKPGASIVRFTGGTLKRGAVWEPDADGDGYPDTLDYSSMVVSNATPSGYVRRLTAPTQVDCAPNDATKWHLSNGVGDADGDGYTAHSFTNPVCIGVSLVAAGYIGSAGTVDCNDSNANIYQNVASLVVDEDYDGYKTANAATTYCVGGQLTNTNGTGRTYYRGPSRVPYYLVSGQVLGSGATDCDDATGAPCEPTGGSAATVLVTGNSQMTLNFTPNITNGPAASNYAVYYATGTLTGAQLLLTGSTATNFSSGSNVTGLSGSTLYSFGVVANNASGSSQISSPFTQTTNTTCTDLIGYRDFDKDGYGAGSNGCYVASGSYNLVGNNTDCNDHDVAIYQLLDGYTNYDGDASYAMARTKVCSGAALPSGYGSSAGTDPNDYNASVTTALTGYSDVSTGADTSCGVVSGVVKCWGWNAYGQLGNGTTTASTIPIAVTGISTATNVSVGYQFACALISGGTVKCWGVNSYGQLGDGTTTNSSTPVTVSGIATATDISIGSNFACALISGGTVKCWGYNYYGQLGDGTTTNSSTPVSVGSITTATQISASSRGSYVCARLSNSTIQCWGENGSYQLGNGTTTSSSTPVSVGGISTAIGISTGPSLACARLSDNTVKCWGYINSTSYSSPAAISGITTSTSIAAGTGFVCSVISGGTVMCSGDNSYGQLGNNSFTNSGLTAVNTLDLSSVSKIVASEYTVCALLTGGQIRCWGNGYEMQFGNNQQSPSSSYRYLGPNPIYLPLTIRGLTGVTKVVSGNINGAYSYCALLSNGGVKCWGLGSLNNSGLPQYVGGVYNAIDLAMGYGFACAIISGGTVQCWGDSNYYGQLGNGTTASSLTPVNVLNITNATAITAAGNTVCAVLSDGTVQCWGQNSSGQLGDGTTTDSSTPVSVIGIATATHIGMYNSSVCVRLSNSTVKCWGQNSSGQLGNGTTTDSLTPVSVSGITTAINVSGGQTYATFCAVLSDATGRCWGDNSRYHLGNGSNVNSSTPVVVSGLTGAIYISATDANYAITNTGGVLFWGMGSNGERGYGDYFSYATPQTANITNATSVARSTSYDSICLSINDGTVKCWGSPSNTMYGLDNMYDSTPRTAVSQ